MRRIRQIFRAANVRRYLRIVVWLLKHLGLLLSASIEVYLRRNFGRRYMRKVIMALLLCLAYTSVAPRQAVLLQVFLCCFVVMLIFQIGFNAARQHLGHPEPHSFWRGEPWSLWREFGLSQSIVRRFFEPGICFLISYLLGAIDTWLSGWLGGAAIALFVQEQIEYFGLRRRVWDMADSRIEAQQIASAVDEHTNPRRAQRDRFHRAHLPR